MTIIELMVTLAVFGLLLMVALPNANEWMTNVRVRSTAESISTGVNRARTEAVKRNALVTFWLVTQNNGVLDATCARSAASDSYVVAMDDPSGKCNLAPSNTDAPRIISFRASQTVNSRIVISALDSGGVSANAVTFNGYGQPVSGAAVTNISTIDVTSTDSGARRLRIMITTGGDMRMCDRDVGVTDPRRCL